MNLDELKVGDTITHYCSGQLVTGTVIETRHPRGVLSQHDPVAYGRDVYTQTWIKPSTELQRSISTTTPAAWHKGIRLKVSTPTRSFYIGPVTR